MPESYYHQPLPLGNWIRVLELAPSKNSDAALQCRLLRLLLTDQSPALPHYEALSYVWGERAGSQKLICEGRTLLITSNCEGALRQLRHARKPRRLWVDSICIDQKSTEERNHQVGLMGYVYSKALQVIVWLGEGNEATSAGMQQLRHYGRIATILGYKVSSALKPLIHKRLHHHSGDAEHSMSECIKVFNANPWFSRIWTLQEIVLAQKAILVYGSDVLTWKGFQRFAESFGLDSFTTTESNCKAIMGRFTMKTLTREKFFISDTPYGIFIILSTAMGLEATLPQDKIYGLSEILRSSGIRLPPPDYAKTLSQLFEETTVAFIRMTESLDVIHVLDHNHQNSELATWVPDWAVNKEFPWSELQYRATRNSKVFHDFIGKTAGKLTLFGKVVGKLRARSDLTILDVNQGNNIDRRSDPYRTPATIAVFRSWLRLAAKLLPELSLPSYATLDFQIKDFFMLRFYQTLIRHKGEELDLEMGAYFEWLHILLFEDGEIATMVETNSLPHPLDIREWVLSRISNHTQCSPPTDPGEEPFDEGLGKVIILIMDAVNAPRLSNAKSAIWLSTLQEYSVFGSSSTEEYSILDFHRKLCRIQRGKSFFITDSSDMGCGPPNVQVDDMIVLFAGSRVPIIVRPDGDFYRFVGPGYIAGLMQGEAWPDDITHGSLKELTLI